MDKIHHILVGLIFCVSIYIIPLALQNRLKKADLVIFSFDRPLQLYALLESVENHLCNIGTVEVIYRYSSDQFKQGYAEVQKKFGQARFVAQSSVLPYQDFKRLTMEAIDRGTSKYILFAVDDIIVTDSVDLSSCIDAIEKHNAYGFYLRLGKNITYSYINEQILKQPKLEHIEHGVYAWRFADGVHEWGWPNSLDMVIYRKKEVISMFEQLSVEQSKTPNLLEGFWDYRFKFPKKTGLCFEKSKIVNVPVNLVQEIWQTRHMNSYSTKELLELFKQGKKIDISKLVAYSNKSVHEEIPFTFMERS